MWNYRVIRRKLEDEDIYAIHAVYYDKKGKPDSVSRNPDWPLGETLEELREDLELYSQALGRPILDYEDFKK